MPIKKFDRDLVIMTDKDDGFFFEIPFSIKHVWACLKPIFRWKLIPVNDLRTKVKYSCIIQCSCIFFFDTQHIAFYGEHVLTTILFPQHQANLHFDFFKIFLTKFAQFTFKFLFLRDIITL